MYIARNERGELVMFEKKPFRCTLNGRGIWMINLEKPFLIHKSLFPELTWEDEPLEVCFVPASCVKEISNGCSAISLMNYIDEHRPNDKMCLSNMECEQIDNAYANNDWETIIKYIKKYKICH